MPDSLRTPLAVNELFAGSVATETPCGKTNLKPIELMLEYGLNGVAVEEYVRNFNVTGVDDAPPPPHPNDISNIKNNDPKIQLVLKFFTGFPF